MPAKYAVPSLDLKSFSCPHCGALAAQDWFEVSAKQTDNPPGMFDRAKLDTLRLDPKNKDIPEAALDYLNQITHRPNALATGH